jgi:hypothetical protein
MDMHVATACAVTKIGAKAEAVVLCLWWQATRLPATKFARMDLPPSQSCARFGHVGEVDVCSID